jgi:hypothetical protein
MIRALDAERAFLLDTLGEQLVVHILHDQIRTTQACPSILGSAFPEDAAIARLVQAAERTKERRLPHTVIPHDTDDLAPGGA